MSRHRFGLVSDTHGVVHPELFRVFEGVDAILHAGDVGGGHVLEELRLIASVPAVAGNVDDCSEDLPWERLVDLPFGKVAIAHGHRFPDSKEARVRALLDRFAPRGVRLILHGHSHIPHLELTRGIFVVNPGAACRPRFGVAPSVCVLEWNPDHDLLRFDFQPLHWE